MTGWQTATRSDLTGPFTATTNTNAQESPPPAAGLQAGYRQTIGNPGGAEVNTVRTILELFDSPGSTRAAIGLTVRGYESVGYSQPVDPARLGLGPDAAARAGPNTPVAPQFAQGTARQGMVFVWGSRNLLLIQVVGGDGGVTLEAATKWVQLVQENLRARGAPPTAPAGWKVYAHPRWGYSLEYPDAWFDLDNFGVPDTQKYFSNERVGAPLQLDQKGIWLTIGVADGSCPPAPAPGPGQRQLMMGGQTVTRTSGYFAAPGGEGGWTIGAAIPNQAIPGQARCFSFGYVALSREARDANLDVADQMISSFRAP